MIARAAAMLILLSQALLIWVALEPNGTTAIWFTFVGTPLLVGGCLLALWTFRRGQRGAPSEPPKPSTVSTDRQ